MEVSAKAIRTADPRAQREIGKNAKDHLGQSLHVNARLPRHYALVAFVIARARPVELAGDPILLDATICKFAPGMIETGNIMGVAAFAPPPPLRPIFTLPHSQEDFRWIREE